MSVRTIIKDTVVDIQPIQPTCRTEEEREIHDDSENENSKDGGRGVGGVLEEEEEEETSAPPACTVHLASGRTLPARAVIVACSNCNPVVPTWAKEEVEEIETPEKEVQNKEKLKSNITTWNQIDLTNPDFIDKNIKNKRVVIVGGGMTAALLALGAIFHQGAEKEAEKEKEGVAATVTIVARRPLLQQPFNCDIGWWGNKYLNAFWQETDPESRMKMCRQARHQASITPQIWAALAKAVELKKIKLIQGYQVDSAMDPTTTTTTTTTTEYSNGCVQLKLIPTPNVDTSKINGALSSSSFSSLPPTDVDGDSILEEEADCVWLACGSAYNITNHPFLSHLQMKYPTRLVAGYPVLDPATCVWPGAPVYLIGRGALLAVGPCAGELVGMRLAADRIVKSLKKLDYSGKTEWEAAAEKLLPLQISTSTTPAAAAALDGAEEIAHPVVSTLQPRTVLENYLELEEHGIMCYQRHIKPSVAHPPHLINISDLPPASELPRQEIQKFSFSDDDFEVSVVVQLPESVPLASVRSLITERSLEVWAVGQEGMYRLHVPRLYGKVLPNRCKIKVNESKKKLYVVLYKEKDTEWRFLKGI
jgi:hypothetical protein